MITLDLSLRAQKKGDLNIKFLVRYEVVGRESQVSQFRFKRIELNLSVKELFKLEPSFHLSKKVSDLYNTQIETVLSKDDTRNLVQLGKPKITEIRLVQPENVTWSLKKKEG